MPIRKGTEALALLEETWEDELIPAATEEMRVVNNFRKSTVTGRFGDTLNISKVAAIVAQTASSSFTGLSLSGTENTEENVTVAASFAYAKAYIAHNVTTDMVRIASFRKGLRTQLAAALATKIDVDGATLVASVSGVKGSGVDHLTKSLLLDSLGTIVKNVRNLWRPGKKNLYLCFHPDELEYVLNIPEITAANVRGDASNPNVSGFVWDAWGMNLDESGNVYQASGVTHNLLHVPESHVKAYNIEPTPLEPQMEELQYRLIWYVGYGVGEVFDEYALDLQTAG